MKTDPHLWWLYCTKMVYSAPSALIFVSREERDAEREALIWPNRSLVSCQTRIWLSVISQQKGIKLFSKESDTEVIMHYLISTTMKHALILCLTVPSFNDPGRKLFQNSLGTRWNAGAQRLSFSHNIFYPINDKFHHLSDIWWYVCNCFQFGYF